MLRYVRYAATVVFALLAVGFGALGVRSYWRLEILEKQTGWHAIQFSSVNGHFAMARIDGLTLIGRSFLSVPAGDAADWRMEGAFGFGYYDSGPITAVIVSHWFLAASSLGLAALLAFKRTWRFSLRSVLVATTILAAVLGLAVYLV